MAPRGRSEPVANSPIAKLLCKIRDDAGIATGEEAGKRAGFSQAKVSRMEKGRTVPSPEDAEHYARVLGATAEVRRKLVGMVRGFHEQHRAAAPGRVAVSRFSASHEKRVRRNEEISSRISVWHPLLLPGALQIEEYVRAVMSSGDLSQPEVEARVTARMERAALVNDSGREFTFIVSAGALGWRVGSPEVMARQIEHIIDMSRPPHIRVAVIPWGTEVDVFPPCGFDIYDDHTAVVGVVGGAAYYNAAADVGRYVTMFAALERLAVCGDEARAVLAGLAAEYRAPG